jgi:hypothetical protein
LGFPDNAPDADLDEGIGLIAVIDINPAIGTGKDDGTIFMLCGLSAG